MTARPVTLRPAQPGDAAKLARLAELDCRRLPDAPLLVAEVGGELLAALPLDGAADPIADPFRPTAELVELLQLRARSARPPRRRGTPRTAPQLRMLWRSRPRSPLPSRPTA